MKIQCDVCNTKEASIFCTADEASLCNECDNRVHLANKLASKHHRLSLLQSSSSKPPICDICQETRALVFCQEDRAILCRECDISLHTSNEYTQKHNRFLLTGIKLSTKLINNDKIIISKTNDNNNNWCDTTVPDYKSITNPTAKSKNKIGGVSSDHGDQQQQQYSSALKESRPCPQDCESDEVNNGGGSSSSNISDYLIETIPGWHFDDFVLDPSSSTNANANAAPFGIFKGDNYNGYDDQVKDNMTSFFDLEEQEKNFTIYSNQSNNLWVPQAPHAPFTFGQPSIFDSPQNGTKKQDFNVKTPKLTRQFRTDDVFIVPQITPSLVVSNKRARALW